MERSVVLVKPDGLQRGVVGEVIHRFERKGLRLSGIKMISLDDALLDEWYAHHKDKSFFPSLKEYMKTAPVVAMLWEGVDAVSTAEAGTVRGDFAMSQQYNLIHASENKEIAQKEEKLMFLPSEVFSWEKTDYKHIYLKEELQ
ncbi:MAG: nucleoside-diphosphate kinase [Candidatus Levybacteria bacterium]|nr:nucleoside-diphosphate kinase [Candidatus Levybacteria bacterium]